MLTVARAAIAAGVLTLLLALPLPAGAASLESVGTYSSPVFVTSDPLDENRLFVVEKQGRIKLREGGQTTTFLDLTAVSPPIVAGGAEQGLLSMAFAPDFSTSGRFFVFYTGTDEGALHVDELIAQGDSADIDTRRPVITIPHPTYDNHNGGQLQTGRDGYLYISTGDGGSGGDPDENAQDVDSLLGKILRIAPLPGGGYVAPGDNPFAGATPGADEVWSYGLRNPWRFSFDRATGDLIIGDVGQGSWEEIDFDPAGSGAGRGDNFGWDCFEGRHDFEPAGCPPPELTTQPVFEYPNPSDSPAAVTGGYVVRDPGLSELYGRYVYADTYQPDVRSLLLGVPDAADDRYEGLAVSSVGSFGEDSCGRVYVASLTGSVERIVDGTPTDCTQPPPQEPPPGPPSDPVHDAGPELTIQAKSPQRLKRGRRVSAFAVTGEPASASVAADVVVGKAHKTLFELPAETALLTPGTPMRLQWRFEPRQAARVRALLSSPARVGVDLTGVATDAAGNRGSAAAYQLRLAGSARRR